MYVIGEAPRAAVARACLDAVVTRVPRWDGPPHVPAQPPPRA